MQVDVVVKRRQCRLSEEEVLISRLLEKALKRSRAIDTEGLCIVAGEKVLFHHDSSRKCRASYSNAYHCLGVGCTGGYPSAGSQRKCSRLRLYSSRGSLTALQTA